MARVDSATLIGDALSVNFGNRRVLRHASLTVRAGESLAIVGQNGAGKSTLLKALVGLVPLSHGSVTFGARNFPRPMPHIMRAMGLVFVPQGQRIFQHMTVEENLRLAGRTPFDSSFESPGELKPLLDRVGYTLSGGERQLLALSMAVAVLPKIMLLDEPFLGLSADSVRLIESRLERLRKDQDVSLVIVEHRLARVRSLVDRVIVIRDGSDVFSEPMERVDERAPAFQEAYFGEDVPN